MGWPRNWTSPDKLQKTDFDLWHDSFIRKENGTETNTNNAQLRNVWWKIDPSEASQGWKSIKQFIEQSKCSLPEVPYGNSYGDTGLGSWENKASNVQDMPMFIQAKEEAQQHCVSETGMPKDEWHNIGKTAVGVIARVDRLKAIGNGQVPAVVRLAWQTLSPRNT
jgi:hypothetical protein